ncbi:MAG: hypothetical protein WC445_02475 [Patescibacteria group bacterium]
MTKKTIRIVAATLFGLLALTFAWAADSYGDGPSFSSPPPLAYFVVFGGFSIACLVMAVLFICKPPPCMKDSPRE